MIPFPTNITPLLALVVACNSTTPSADHDSRGDLDAAVSHDASSSADAARDDAGRQGQESAIATDDDVVSLSDDEAGDDLALDDDLPNDDDDGPTDDDAPDDDTSDDVPGGRGGATGSGGSGGLGNEAGNTSTPDAGAGGTTATSCQCNADVNGDGEPVFFREDNGLIAGCMGREPSTPCELCRGGTCAAADIDCNGVIDECDTRRLVRAEVGETNVCDIPCGACCVPETADSLACSGSGQELPCCRKYEEEWCASLGGTFLGAEVACPADCPNAPENDACRHVTGMGPEPWHGLMVIGTGFGAHEGALVRVVTAGADADHRQAVAQARIVDGGFEVFIPESLNDSFPVGLGLYVDENRNDTCDPGEASRSTTTPAVVEYLTLEVTPDELCDTAAAGCIPWSDAGCEISGFEEVLSSELDCPW